MNSLISFLFHSFVFAVFSLSFVLLVSHKNQSPYIRQFSVLLVARIPCFSLRFHFRSPRIICLGCKNLCILVSLPLFHFTFSVGVCVFFLFFAFLSFSCLIFENVFLDLMLCCVGCFAQTSTMKIN